MSNFLGSLQGVGGFSDWETRCPPGTSSRILNKGNLPRPEAGPAESVHSVTRTGIDYIYGVAAVETGGKQQSTGLLHFDRSIPVRQKKTHTEWCVSFFGERRHSGYEYYALIRRQFHEE